MFIYWQIIDTFLACVDGLNTGHIFFEYPLIYWYPLNWYPSWYPLKVAQNIAAHLTAHQNRLFSTQRKCTQQKPLLVSRKTISRRTSRSKCLYFLANRASANSGTNSKVVVTKLLVTSEMMLSKLQLSTELSTENRVTNN
jgi:hypothetical protein